MRISVLLLALLCFVTQPTSAQTSTDISFQHDGKTVYGTFSKPAGNGPFTTVIINPGSGANDRHGTAPMEGGNVQCLYPALTGDTLRPYRDLANALVDSGFAVLRYDKIEYTYPTSPGTITFHKLWLPVESAIGFVKTLPDVDSNRIVLLGHSEGSTLVPYIAKNRNDVKALISLAGPRQPLDSLLAYQIIFITQTCGGDMTTAQTQAAQILDYFSTVRSNAWTSSTPALFGVPASVWFDYIRVADSVSINYNLTNVPQLFIGLGEDFNVPPPELQRFQNEITGNADFYSLPGLNHFGTTSDNPILSEALSDTIVFWLRQHGFTGIKKTPTTTSNLSIYTTADAIYVNRLQPQSGRVLFYASDGRLIRTLSIPAERQTRIDTSDLPDGICFVTVVTSEVCAAKIIVR